VSYAFPANGFGADAEFDAFLYGQTHPAVTDFLSNQFNKIGSAISDATNNFRLESKNLYDHFNSNAVVRFARNTVNKFFGVNDVKIDNIQFLTDIGQFQNAGLNMQRWVMANPTVRQLYHDQQIDGYSSTYVDMSPNDIGADHYDYRRVNDGVMKFSKEDDWKCIEYLDELKEGDRDLMIDEKSDILHSWSNLEYLLSLCGKDPTSKDNGSM